MLDKNYFVDEKEVEKFTNIMFEWDEMIDNCKSKISDEELTIKLQKTIENKKEPPKINSITKDKPEDHMFLNEIKYESDKEEFKLTVIFKSPLGTSATLENTYKKI